MNEASRAYTTAGVALMSAGLIVAVPVAPVAPVLGATVAIRDVTLTAGFEDVFADASANLSALGDGFSDAFQALTQAIDGNSDWFSALVNPQELFGALTFLAGDQKEFLNPLAAFTLNGGGPDYDPETDITHAFLYTLLTNQLSGALDPGVFPPFDSPLPEVINALSSPLSGVLLGAVSPLVAPVVPFLNPFFELFGDLVNNNDPDVGALFEGLLSAPLNAIAGFFNGSVLDLDVLVPLVGQLGLLPEGDAITGLDFGFGGLLSPGLVGADPADFHISFGDSVPGGGSIFNALGLDLTFINPADPGAGAVDVAALAHGVGPFGALIGLTNVFASLFSGDLDFANGAAALDIGSVLPDISQFFDLGQWLDFSWLDWF